MPYPESLLDFLWLRSSGAMAKRSAAMCWVGRRMPAPSAWAWHPKNGRTFWETALAHVFAVALSCVSCSLLRKGSLFPQRARSLIVEELGVCLRIDQNANQRSAVAVDLLLVYDEKLLEVLGAMKAQDWFDQRRQFRRDFGGLYEPHEWEWAPDPTPPTVVIHHICRPR